MILVADSGSTKTDWILAENAEEQSRFSTIGFNPYFTNSTEICHLLHLQLLPELNERKIETVFFYGAGCLTEEKINVVQEALMHCFPHSRIVVSHDMLGAARALLGHTNGFVAIIGTGSNTCLYDGIGITKNIDSLGYILGDEGSGSYIGKKIVRDFMRQYLPDELHQKFNEAYQLGNEDIFDSLYNKQFPNRFLAGFCKFAHENKEHPYIKTIVADSFNDFFKNLVSKYPDYQKYSFNCVGSVSFIFKEILAEVASSYNMKMGKIIPSPIENLVKFHLTENVTIYPA